MSFATVTPDVLAHILSYLHASTRVVVRRVCSAWRDACPLPPSDDERLIVLSEPQPLPVLLMALADCRHDNDKCMLMASVAASGDVANLRALRVQVRTCHGVRAYL
jgi:hypothetical protein